MVNNERVVLMDIVVRDVDKPKTCGECPFRDGFPSNCSISVLPKGHGRLADIDAFLKEWKGRYYEGSVEDLINCMEVIVDKDDRIEERGIAEEA